jgi:transposase
MLAGMKAYSKDLREVVEVFGVSLPSIKRWLKMKRESTNIEAPPIAGPPGAKRAMLLEWLLSQLQCHNVPHHRPPSGFLAAQKVSHSH